MSDKISDERLKRVGIILECFKQDYDPVEDRENFEAMRDAMEAVDELLIARRAAEVKPVKLQGGSLRHDGRFWYPAETVKKLIEAAGGTVKDGE